MNVEAEALLRQLAGLLSQRVHDEMQGQPWSQSFLDTRFDGRGGFSTKIRTVTSSSDLHSIGMTTEISLVLIELDQCRRDFGSEWFGIIVTVSADDRCSVDFNYDPNCADDETFFDT